MSDGLTVAISSRALFDLRASNDVYEHDGLEAYRQYQITHEEQTLNPGEGFNFVVKLLNINKLLNKDKVEVILLSRNSGDTGLRIFNSIRDHGLDITRAAFCGGESPYRYIQAFGCDLFLSTHSDDVSHALAHGVAAATLLPNPNKVATESDGLRLAFDGDSVLFSDEAERVYQARGLEAFAETETRQAGQPLAGGPFKSFLSSLHQLQQEFGEERCPIRTALVTARSAPAHERVIRTLRAWDIRIDESLFLGGKNKTEFLRAFNADVFFDDQSVHVERASEAVTSGHVPSGIVNTG
ncbi:MAG: 5'-nucleotidase [Proteobacteria bacterium]|nr:5'-nucleotidase [Pseudomonadota bacterium]